MTATLTDASARLSAADARRDGSDADRTAALAVYAELADAIDPATPEGASRVEWVLELGIAPAPEFEGVLGRTVAEAADPHLRRIAAGVLYHFDLARGDVRGAETRLAALVREMAADGAPEVCAVAANLSQVFASQGREFETLVTARRAVRLAWEHGIGGVLAIALSRVVWALTRLHDWSAAAAATDEIERLVPGLAAAHVPLALRMVHRTRAQRAFALGTLDVARDEVAAFLALDRVSQPTPQDRAHADLLAAALAFTTGRPADAEVLAGRVVDRAAPTTHAHLEAAAARVRAIAAQGHGERAGRVARSLLGPLHSAIRRGALVAPAFEAAVTVARSLEPDASATPFVVIASEALFARIGQLEECVGALDGLTDEAEEDRARLASYRAQFVETHRDVLATISRLHDGSHAGPPAVLSALASEGRLRVCAWCLTVETPDGRHLPVGHLVPHLAALEVSHGMCDACRSRFAV